MVEAIFACGRVFRDEIIERIRTTLQDEPTLSRAALARRVCEWLDWKSPNGRFQCMSCRVALLKLHRQGLITLPAPRRQVPAVACRPARGEGPSPAVVTASVEQLQRVDLVPVGGRSELARLWNELVATYHYLGYRPLVGAQQRYLIGSEHGWLGAVGFSAAAWHLGPRDAWIGWSGAARAAHLREVVCNSRFLIVPGVAVANLASKVLALCAQRLPADWQAVYGYAPVLLETYVERDRFAGTCYRAANWIQVGSTQGRGRQDRRHAYGVPVKDIYLSPLRADFRNVLCQAPAVVPARPQRPAPRTPPPPPPQDWAEEEFGAVRLGDARLRRRLLTMARDFYAHPQANVPQACGSRAKTKAAYRWFDHEAVTMQHILASHYAATAQRVRQQSVVLAVQDTTSLNYSTHPATEGLGPMGTRPEGVVGLLLHPTLALTPEGVPLGLLDVQVWARDPAEFGKRHRRYELPIEQKESHKWLHSFEAVAKVQAQAPTTTLVSVGDREADVYELFQLAASQPGHPKLLVRAERDRLVAEGHEHCWAYVARQPLAGVQALHVPRHPGQPARVAQLEVRCAAVVLRPPRRKPKLGPVRVWAVQAREAAPPPGVEPVEWLLLTTLKVDSFAQATEKLAWYTQRWHIEVYHRTLKSGCRIEQRQLGTAERLENCLAIDLVVAWRILHLTKLGRETPEAPCTAVLEDHEWKALYAFVHQTPQVPPAPPSVREAIRMVASLGGFLGRKGDGEPGTQTLWLGLQRLDDIATAWRIFTLTRPPPRAAPNSTVSSPPNYG